MKILFGTGNRAKLSVLKPKLEMLGVELIGLWDLPAEGKAIPKVIEDGSTLSDASVFLRLGSVF